MNSFVNSEVAKTWVWKPLLAVYLAVWLWNNPWIITQYYPGPMFADHKTNCE